VVPSFNLTSETVHSGVALPIAQLSGIFGVPDGLDASPQLSWSGFPAETRSFVVTMYDPQAPSGSGFWHWAVADIPASTTSLAEGAGAPDGAQLPSGAFQLRGDAGMARYIGGAPPAGSGRHDYIITVSAFDADTTGIGPDASVAFWVSTLPGTRSLGPPSSAQLNLVKIQGMSRKACATPAGNTAKCPT
jgi:Raf kinase inhibitor-like YbhB/YbcL family protein